MEYLRDHLYCLEYRIKVALGMYGYCYSLYVQYSEPEWSWHQYLFSNLSSRPDPIISFSDYDDAYLYLIKYPELMLYIRVERYVP